MTTAHDFQSQLNRESNFIAGYIIWRTYFPGVFSGLFSIVFAKDARVAESVKASVLIVVLQLIRTVGRDRLHTLLLNPVEPKGNVTLFQAVFKPSVSTEVTESLKRDLSPVSSIGTGLPFVDGNVIQYLVTIFFSNVSFHTFPKQLANGELTFYKNLKNFCSYYTILFGLHRIQTFN